VRELAAPAASSGLCAETPTVCTDCDVPCSRDCLSVRCSLTGPHVWQTLGSQSLELDPSQLEHELAN